MFRKDKVSAASDRLFEEKLYEQVAQEIQSGELKTGLWAKAIAKTSGDKEVAKAHYIELRVQAIKDEISIAEDAAEHYKNNQTQARKSSKQISEEKEKLKKEKARIKAKAYAVKHAAEDSSGCLFFFKVLAVCLVLLLLIIILGS